MPVTLRAHRVWQLQSLLALWVAVLLAVVPFARPSLPGHAAWLQAASGGSSTAREIALPRAEESTPRLRADRSDVGVLPRSPYIEATFAPPPGKAPVARLAAPDAPLLAPKSTGAFASDAVGAFHRSSVGTARTPTGPPA